MDKSTQKNICNDILESMRKVTQHTNMDHYQIRREMNNLYVEYLDKCSDEVTRKILNEAILVFRKR